MDLRRLEILVAVAQSPTLAAAARELGMTQPGVSQALRALESDVGFLIARKSGRKLELTPAAMRLAEDAATALRCVAVSLKASRAISEGKAGLLRVAFTAASLAGIAAQTLKALRLQAPDLTLEVFEMTTIDQVAALLDGRIDAGFLHGPLEADLDIVPLLEDSLMVVLPTDHPASPMLSVPLIALKESPFVLYPRNRGPVLYDRFIAACEAAGFAPKLAESVLPWGAAMELVAVGFGVTLSPTTLARNPPPGTVSRPLNPAELILPHSLALARRRRTEAENLLVALARKLATAKKSL